jgi:hypothetical protein
MKIVEDLQLQFGIKVVVSDHDKSFLIRKYCSLFQLNILNTVQMKIIVELVISRLISGAYKLLVVKFFHLKVKIQLNTNNVRFHIISAEVLLSMY